MTNPCIFIQGPTATGKSSLALRLARKIGACIVNADSIQLYASLQIGAAGPTPQERALVDHFLYQVIPSGETWTASHYEEEAWRVVAEELKFRPVIVVGGSGFYFRALEQGMGEAFSESEKVKEQLEDELEAGRAPWLYEELQKVDPGAAAKIHPNDHYRLLRALGYHRTYGRPLSEDQKLGQHREWPGGLLKVGLTGTQDELREIIRLRVESMMSLGFEDEVKRLLAQGLEDWWPLQSVGYKEVLEVLKGVRDRKNLVEDITQSTLYLAKRQKTWFKRDQDVEWFSFKEKDRALEWILSQPLLDLFRGKAQDGEQA